MNRFKVVDSGLVFKIEDTEKEEYIEEAPYCDIYFKSQNKADRVCAIMNHLANDYNWRLEKLENKFEGRIQALELHLGL